MYDGYAWFVKTANSQVQDEDCIEENLRRIHASAYRLIFHGISCTNPQMATPYDDGIIRNDQLPDLISRLRLQAERLKACRTAADFFNYCVSMAIPEPVIRKELMCDWQHEPGFQHAMEQIVSRLTAFLETAHVEQKHIGVLGL
jgi:hypothetical protein